jgi:hypothetical protein
VDDRIFANTKSSSSDSDDDDDDDDEFISTIVGTLLLVLFRFETFFVAFDVFALLFPLPEALPFCLVFLDLGFVVVFADFAVIQPPSSVTERGLIDLLDSTSFRFGKLTLARGF